MLVDVASCGSECSACSSASHLRTLACARSKASRSEVVSLSASARKALPNHVISDSTPRPNEVRSERAEVITMVESSRSASMNPPE